MNNLTKENLEYLYLECGLSAKQLSKRFNISIDNVYNLLKENNINLNKSVKKKIPPKQELENMYLVQKMNLNQISNHFGVESKLVSKWFKKLGIETKKKKREILDKPTKNELKALYEKDGLNQTQIAKRFEVSRSLVRKWMREYGIENTFHTPVISKEKLIELYIDKKMTATEIANIYGVKKHIINHLCSKYNLPNRLGKRAYYHLKAVPFTEQQRSFFIGSMLGDGNINHGGKKHLGNYRFSVNHAENRLDYLLWKKEILNNYVNTIHRYEQKKRNSITCGFHTISHNELSFFHKLFYDNNKKVIRDEIIHYLDDFAMAVWLMDDGSRHSCCITLHTNGFSKKENETLQNAIKINFGINCKVVELLNKKNNKQFYVIRFNKRNSILLTKLVEPYILECFKYKLVYDKRSSTTERQAPKKDDDTV